MFKLTIYRNGAIRHTETEQEAIIAEAGEVFGNLDNRTMELATDVATAFVQHGTFHVMSSESRLVVVFYEIYNNLVIRGGEIRGG